ncbi:MAG: type II toxin-antitoxin system mRNA interferase toxin, RelE/StbE family [Candidatus Schekmanbacteria bacterium]|nr:type II toxin-antitoxin system mRNA interferase toxin, RelE/StbE family [Candidatus Schekmanbacteria bacterium]
MIKLQWTLSFKKDYQDLAENIKEQAKKQFRLLSENPRHPSLRVKKMAGTVNIWEARITKGYRLTFQIEGEVFLLRRIGGHDILKKP